jgi:K+ transporter
MKLIMIVGILGAAMFYGDGMVTPAISVLSAVEGLEIATPAFKPFVIPITLIVLFGLFFTSSGSGTAVVGTFFGPVMLLWFSTLACSACITSWLIRPFCSNESALRYRIPARQQGDGAGRDG